VETVSGIVSASSGLRGTSYPEFSTRLNFNLNGVASRFPDQAATPMGLSVFGLDSQGSSFLATLGFELESPWVSTTEFSKGIGLSLFCQCASFRYLPTALKIDH
jgi:hypothetical protein